MQKYSTTINTSDLIKIIEVNSINSKELITAKGFVFTENELPEKIALIHTEVAELSDAIKKGKGKNEEGEELADIVIRLLNIPYLYPEVLKGIYDNKISSTIEVQYEAISEFQCKYLNSCNMHSAVSGIGEFIADYQFFKDQIKKKEDKKQPVDLTEIGVNNNLFMIAALMLSITGMCYFYCANFLHENLQDLIDKKMRKNWDRPYRYNTSPEHFQ